MTRTKQSKQPTLIDVPIKKRRGRPPGSTKAAIALQKSIGNQATIKVLKPKARTRKPTTTTKIKAKTKTKTTSKARFGATLEQGAWEFGGRPNFAKATNEGMPVQTGEHRAHTTSWETIRTVVAEMLNSDGTLDHIYEVALVHLLEPFMPEANGFDVPGAFEELRAIRGRKSDDDVAGVQRILTGLNQLLQNLDPGHGPTNSSIKGHFDPKVVATQDGGWDIREEHKTAISSTAHLVSGLLLSYDGTQIYASTFPGGRINVSDARGMLKEMVDGNWFTKVKTKPKTKN